MMKFGLADKKCSISASYYDSTRMHPEALALFAKGRTVLQE